MDLTGVIIAAASVVSSVVVGAGRIIYRVLKRHEQKIDAIADEGAANSRRNCVHHGILFDHLDINRSIVAEAEQAAGLLPKGHA